MGLRHAIVVGLTILSTAIVAPRAVPTAMAKPAGITVTVDGEVVVFVEVKPRLAGDRVIVPLAAMAQAFGGDLIWKPQSHEATVLAGNRYVWTQISNVNLYSGQYGYDANGSLQFLSVTSVTLETRPEMVKDRVMVQLNALVAGLGGEISWDGETMTAHVTMPETARPMFTRQGNPDVREKSSFPSIKENPLPAWISQTLEKLASEVFFQMLGVGSATQKYLAGEPFIMVMFNDKAADSNIPVMQDILQAAADLKMRVYGFDLLGLEEGDGTIKRELNLAKYDISEKSSDLYIGLVFGGGKSETVKATDYQAAYESMQSYWKRVR